MIPYVGQAPYELIPEGRSDPQDHQRAKARLSTHHIARRTAYFSLPVAALPQRGGEFYLAFRAKKRPVLGEEP